MFEVNLRGLDLCELVRLSTLSQMKCSLQHFNKTFLLHFRVEVELNIRYLPSTDMFHLEKKHFGNKVVYFVRSSKLFWPGAHVNSLIYFSGNESTAIFGASNVLLNVPTIYFGKLFQTNGCEEKLSNPGLVH